MYFERTSFIFLKACYLLLHIGALSNISNILWKCSLKIMTTIHFKCDNAFPGRAWYVTSLCPNTIGFAGFPNNMGEMTCILGKSLSIIVRTFAKEKEKKNRVESVQNFNFRWVLKLRYNFDHWLKRDFIFFIISYQNYLQCWQKLGTFLGKVLQKS